jgi:hypothetical protein
VKLLLIAAVFVNKSSINGPTFSASYSELLLVDSRRVLLSYHFVVESTRYSSGETQKRKTVSYGKWKVNIVKSDMKQVAYHC